MLECTFISRLVLLAIFALVLAGGSQALADETAPPPASATPGADNGGQPPQPKTLIPEEDDFSSTPFTKYGEFNETNDEDEDTRFFQYGRFFGFSIGLGAETVSGNRGLLWQGGFPLVDLKLHYWFDFNFAIDMGIFFVSHNFNNIAQGTGQTTVNMVHLGADLKYYFDTKNLSAAISFANPYVLLGVGQYTKTQTPINGNGQADSDSGVDFGLGAGLEFAIRPRKVYFEVEGKVHFVSFKDTNTTVFQSQGIQDLTGQFYTFSGNLLFTW